MPARIYGMFYIYILHVDKHIQSTVVNILKRDAKMNSLVWKIFWKISINSTASDVQVHFVPLPRSASSCPVSFQANEVFGCALRFQVSEDNMKCVFKSRKSGVKVCTESILCWNNSMRSESILRSKNDIAYKIGDVIHIHSRLLTLNHWNLFVLYVKCVFISLREHLTLSSNHWMETRHTHTHTNVYGRSLISWFLFWSFALLPLLLLLRFSSFDYRTRSHILLFCHTTKRFINIFEHTVSSEA